MRMRKRRLRLSAVRRKKMSTATNLVSARTLTPDDAVDVLDEILEAQNQSYVLGLRLKLPLHVVDAIFSRYLESDKRLLHIIIEFSKQVEPRPTWRVIVDALRTPAVNMPQLARRVEETYLPCRPLQRADVFPETGIIFFIYTISKTWSD